MKGKILMLTLFFLLFSSFAFAWWNTSYTSRIEMNVSGMTYYNQTMIITITNQINASKTNGSDLRVTCNNSGAETVVGFWRQESSGGQTAYPAWNSTNANGTLYVMNPYNASVCWIYYNASTVSDTSSIDAASLIGDDFDTTFNTSKWNVVGDFTYNNTGGIFYFTQAAYASGEGFWSKATTAYSDMMIIGLYKNNNGCSGDCRTGFGFNQSAANSYRMLERQSNDATYILNIGSTNGTWLISDPVSVTNTIYKIWSYNLSTTITDAQLILNNNTIWNFDTQNSTSQGPIGQILIGANKGQLDWVMGIRAPVSSPTFTFGPEETYLITLNVSLSAPGNNTITNVTTQIFNFTALDSIYTSFNCSIYRNGILNQTNSSVLNNTLTSFTLTGIPDGLMYWNVTCTDNASTTNTSAKWQITIDTSAPSITLNAPANNTLTNISSQLFNFTQIDSFSSTMNCSLYIDNNLNMTNSSTLNNTATVFNVSLADGFHYWNITCKDLANNSNTSLTNLIKVDLTPPAITLNSPANNTYTSNPSVVFNFTATDNFATSLNCSLYINATLNQTNSSVLNNTPTTFPVTFGSDGNYTWNVSCFDNFFRNTSLANVVYINSNSSVLLTIYVDLNNPTYETERSRYGFSVQSSVNPIKDINISTYYNNTLYQTYTQNYSYAGNISSYAESSFVYAPLVSVNNTNIPVSVYANVSLYNDTTLFQLNSSENHVVMLYYTATSFVLTRTGVYSTLEDGANFSFSVLAQAPRNYLNDTNKTYFFSSKNCTLAYANITYNETTCINDSITTYNVSSFRLDPSHAYTNGLLTQIYNLYSEYNFSFTSPTGNSSKSINISNPNAMLERFVWLVNSSNGSINGSSNITTIINVTFYDEINLTALSIDSMASNDQVTFADGSYKMFYISYGNGTGTISNGLIRAYPNSSESNILIAEEVYSKSGYTTRARFLYYSNTSFGSREDVRIYLLPNSYATTATINVVNRGTAVSGARIQILKYYAGTGAYLNVEQKITNPTGQAQANLQMDAYYKFNIYDSSGSLIYTSPSPVQFIYGDGIYSITIDISASGELNFISPTVTADCYGNNATNAIIFSYYDYTGLTHSMKFYAWRSFNTSTVGGTPVCNYSISGSSGGYVCTLSGGESLSSYPYYCQVRLEASPERVAADRIIDYVGSGSVQDGMFVGLTIVLALGVGVLNPIAGIIGAGVGVTFLYTMGIVPLTQTFIVDILLIGALLVLLKSPSEQGGGG